MKQLILSVALLILISSCGKNEEKVKTSDPTPSSSTTVKLKVNGVDQELSYTPLWTYDSDPGIYGLGITQNKTGASAAERKMVSIRIEKSVLVVGVAQAVGVGNNNELIYIDNYNSTKAQYKANKNFEKSHATFTLTKIKEGNGTTKNFYGSFNGTLYNTNGDSIVITEGQIIE